MTPSPNTPRPPTAADGDEALLLAARRDHEAFAVLYDRHAAALAGWLRRRSDPDTAQELLAETFAQAWHVRRRYRSERGSIRAWLYAIAQNLLFGYYRRLQVEDRARRRLGVVVESPTATFDDANARLDAAALRADLAASLSRLTPAVRDAIVLRVVDQLAYDELAARLGCSERAARLRVHRGLRSLRRDQPSESRSVPAAQGVLS